MGSELVSERGIAELRERLRGPVLAPGDDGYDAARRIWNAMIDRQPGAIARCTGAADVMAAVRVARERDLLVSVRGGGHNVAGTAVCEGGLMIDLQLMKGIHVGPAARRAFAQPGLLWGELDRETAAFGLATTGGLVSTTGIAGFTLGGGLGWLMRQHGLACDNLRSAQVVTADGDLVTASPDDNSELFWGIRGGGGNFGIVTMLEHELYPHRNVLAGAVLHPFERAGDLLRSFRDVAADAPDELTAHAGLISGPDGTKMGAVLACYASPDDAGFPAGERALEPLRSFSSPLADTIGVRPYVEWQAMFDEANAYDCRNYWKSSVLKRLEDGAIDAAVERFASAPSVRSSLLIEGLGGAVARVDEDATAYTHRDAAFDFLISSIWDDPADDEANVSWTRQTFEALTPYARGSVYVNYLGSEGEDRVRQAYGPAKYDRLVELKNRYDPTNLFQLNQNIKPTASRTRVAAE